MTPTESTLLARLALGLLWAGTAAAASAQMTPVGTWRSVDENGQPKAQVRIEAQGEGASQVLTGRIEKVLRAGADPKAVCDKCTDARKDQPIVGLEIIRGAKKGEGDVWEGGRILDPEKGSDYGLRLTPIEGGAKLQVRGSLGPFFRTQTWQRVN
ncbi:hypothetical protein CCO03_18040 [Comamonas serinivorans]|uniref:DUF2147 domain-containing protein n=1 Tax=Comamonas serinivorans TaxID=1082851 RepID=A0A1Y0ERU5_9BURK|nr:DUF2147 domain-containing protein [Comamonas serinivorans]ARU06323.1 hypothetical protein CCO03_18040 [Comamonas serinivorans]